MKSSTSVSKADGAPWSMADRALKRGFDLLVSAFGLTMLGWLMVICILVSTVETRRIGLFRQRRVGRHGRGFTILKIRTMGDAVDKSTITTAKDPRVTRFGAFMRRYKLDELPQLINVIIGHMSLVGPRPDVAGYADRLAGADRIVLSVRPGITGPATLAFRDEERQLAESDDPVRYNDEVIYPEKVRINREYVMNYSFLLDLRCIVKTILGGR